MGLSLHQAYHYLNYQYHAKGPFALHSPFVFKLFSQVIKKSKGFRINEIEKARVGAFKDHSIIDVSDFKSGISQRKTISSVAKTSSSTPRFSSFLHLLCQFMDIKVALETGTFLGFTTAYLAKAVTEKVISLEGSPLLGELAIKNLNMLGIDQVQVLKANIHSSFMPAIIQHQPELIFLDADHRGEVTLQFINDTLREVPGIKCIVVHDIYWSKDMTDAWKKLIADDRISLTIDLFQAGVIFPHRNSPKQHFTLRF